jgi:hypothetical protein
VANRQHVIELNGKQYDAQTGKMVSGNSASPVKQKPLTPDQPKRLDGFVRRKLPALSPTMAKKLHNKPERSKTLMRTVVKKPVAPKPLQKVTPKPDIVTQAIKKPNRAESVNPERALHASLIHKSNLVSKFGKTFTSHHIKSDIVPVKVAPGVKPLKKTAVAIAKPLTARVVANPFDTALENATSHEQPKPKKTAFHHKVARKLHISPGTLIAGSTGMVLLLIAGFWAYTNVPNVAVRVAAMRAGVSASVPSYQPAGFSLKGPISYQPGQITINYKSTSDDRDFSVVQRASNWNSETLLDNFVDTKNQAYQTVEANGRTIYIYDGGNATWVDGGTWYQVLSKSTLSSDQLLRIANSL